MSWLSQLSTALGDSLLTSEGFRRFESYCAHNFRILDSACRSAKPRSPHRESPASRKKSNRKYRISSYGLTQEQFDRLLVAQHLACGMCHKPFAEEQLIQVDHDHACCQRKNR